MHVAHRRPSESSHDGLVASALVISYLAALAVIDVAALYGVLRLDIGRVVWVLKPGRGLHDGDIAILAIAGTLSVILVLGIARELGVGHRSRKSST